MNRIKSGILNAKSGDLVVSGADTATRRYCFDNGFVGFHGHFPGYPVIPAFVQVLSALTVMEEWNGGTFRLLALPKAKFHKELKPGQEVSVMCKQYAGQEGILVDAKLTTAEGLAADFCMIVEKL